jgi:HD-GYP domain-containing protein (c-di-GMP phosphodiesterase class II)
MDSRIPLIAGLAVGAALVVRERRSRGKVERFAAAGLETILNAIEANDRDTGLHVRRVAAYSLIIAEFAGLNERQSHAVERVALFHDIGKIHEALFDIVHDDHQLSEEDRKAIDTHPRRGAEVLAPLEAFYPELAAGVLSHHERWDGSGYPRRLKGKRIPLEARIVTIADTFDAVSHSRRYRKGRGIDHALDVIREGRGTQFDPELVDLVLLPPVVARLTREHIEARRPPSGRRSRAKEPEAPDIRFRWRSESLGSSGLRATHHVD